MVRKSLFALIIVSLVFVYSCDMSQQKVQKETKIEEPQQEIVPVEERLNHYVTVDLKTDLSGLSDSEKEMIKIFINAATLVDDIFWMQTFGDKYPLLEKCKNENEKKYVEINYGPWDRLDGMVPFIKGYDKRPIGANYYPADIKYLQFVDMKFEDKFSKYTILRRNNDGSLYTIPYNQAYKEEVTKLAELLRKAAGITEDSNYSAYLELKAQSILTDEYYDSDIAWMDLKNNIVDFIVGPIEDEDDEFLNTKCAYESYVLVKDTVWSAKTAKYVALLPELKRMLPCDQKYKEEEVASGNDIFVCDAIYYSGFCNAGSKTLSVNRPKDPRVHMLKGIRNLQFKNVNQHKFDNILKPISELVIDSKQRHHVKFEAFFMNNIFYELAENLNVKNTITNKGTVKQALKYYFNTINVASADITRMYLITKLKEMGELEDVSLMDNYVTYMADLFRSVRFGTGHPQGKANMVRFYFFKEAGAFTRNESTGMYSVDLEKTKRAIEMLTEKMIRIQGDGDFNAAKELVEEKGYIREKLENDLQRISEAGIPKDIIFNQGEKVLGL